uniref:Uncharacterized protein n=1 Tax=Eutreptiella gymnastica TaxID=73025 RepID=A0A7S1HY14_9EUGL
MVEANPHYQDRAWGKWGWQPPKARGVLRESALRFVHKAVLPEIQGLPLIGRLQWGPLALLAGPEVQTELELFPDQQLAWRTWRHKVAPSGPDEQTDQGP